MGNVQTQAHHHGEATPLTALVKPQLLAASRKHKPGPADGIVLIPRASNAAASKGDDLDQEVVARTQALWKQIGSQEGQLKRAKQSASQSKHAVSRLRDELSKELTFYKRALVGKGCEGKWGSFLLTIGMPRPTADRYVRSFQANEQAKLITEELPPVQDPVTALAKHCERKLATHAEDAVALSKLLQALAEVLRGVAKTCADHAKGNAAEVAQ